MLDYEHPKQYIINKVKVSGIKYLDPEVVASMSGLTKGDTIMIPSDYLSSTLKTMWNQRIYSDVQILTEPVGDSVNIEIVLRERPRVYDWKIEGVRKGQMSELLETLKLKKGSELSDFVLNSSKDAIRKYFAEKGFYNADVSVRLENDTTLENVVNVFFVVDRKNRVKIGKIDFEGNTALSDRQLRRSFKKTHQKSINIFKGAKYKEKDYEEDKENLIDFYNSRGYRNATILSDSVYRINDKRLGIALKVDEGNKFYYRNVSWTGNSVYETRQLNDMLGISKGETYDKKTLHKRLGIGKHADYEDMSSISSLYQNNGYLFSSIDPGEVVVGEDSIDINVKIFEGKQAKINEVKISGNHRVNDRVIRRELYVRPGELYNRALLMQTIRQLNQMQHFDPEKTSPGIDLVPNSNELVDIS
ncbi:BamA/OMP85 family outer membrane protein, partial [Alistipes ihumii]